MKTGLDTDINQTYAHLLNICAHTGVQLQDVFANEPNQVAEVGRGSSAKRIENFKKIPLFSRNFLLTCP